MYKDDKKYGEHKDYYENSVLKIDCNFKDNKIDGEYKDYYENGKLKTMAQADKIFAHPHDVCVDDEGSIYVAQWASGKVYPYKLTRV